MHHASHKEPDPRLIEDDEWLDEVLRETFPASDPIPLFHRTPEIEHQGNGFALELRDSTGFVKE
jgi:hypothetical protein